MALILFIIYVVTILGMSFIHINQNNIHFLVNNRNSSTSTVMSSIVASCIGASATIGVVGLAFYAGTPAFWWLGSGALGLIILGVFLAKKVRLSQVYTLSELVEFYLGKQAMYLASIIIVLAWTAIVAAQLTACTMLVMFLIDCQQITALLISALLIMLHTLLGGQASIMKLDKLQFTIIIGGLFLLFIWLMNINSHSLNNIHLELSNSQFPVGKLIYFLLILGGSYIVCPMLYGRVLSAKNEESAKKGVIAAALVLIISSIIMVLIGLLARGLIPSDTPIDQVLFAVSNNVLPHWLLILLYLVLLSAVISSADSCLLTAGITLAHHVFFKRNLLWTRLSIILLMALAVLITSAQKSILELLLMANDIYVCSIVAPIFLCIVFNKNKQNINQNIVLFGIMLAGGCGMISAISANYYFSYGGITIAILLTLLSFVVKKNNQQTVILK